jgi:hypothetical protein
MKIRRGFVSNSSSSSFVCDVCDESVSGMDMGLSDAEMFECVVGHVVCDSHSVAGQVEYYDLDLEGKREYCLARVDYESIKETIKEAEHESEIDDLYSDEIQYDERYNTPAESCPCCTLDKPTDAQVTQFLLSEAKTTREEVVKQIQERFTNYDEMCKKLGL